MSTHQAPSTRSSWLRPRFTIGEMMLVILVSGLAMAPVAMYLQNARIELIVATVACETIGLPVLTTLVLIAVMEPGPERTKRIVRLCCIPIVVLATAGFGLVYLAGLIMGIREFIVEIRHGNYVRVPVLLFIVLLCVVQYFVFRRYGPRCPACRSVRIKRMSFRSLGRSGRCLESFQCRNCGAHSHRIHAWLNPLPIALGEYAESPQETAVTEAPHS